LRRLAEGADEGAVHPFRIAKAVDCATRSIASLEDCTRCRATSMRRRSTAFDGVLRRLIRPHSKENGIPLLSGPLRAGTHQARNHRKPPLAASAVGRLNSSPDEPRASPFEKA